MNGVTQDSYTEACKLEKEIRMLEEKISHLRSSNANAKQISQLETKLDRSRDALQKTGRKWEVSKLTMPELERSINGSNNNNNIVTVDGKIEKKTKSGGCC